MNKQGIILCGHGSKSNEGIMEFLEMTKKFSDLHPDCEVTCGFLEFHEPSFENAIIHLRSNGVREVYVVPAFLFTGVHFQYDIPLIFKLLGKKYPEMKIRMASYIGVCEQVVSLVGKLINTAYSGDNTSDRADGCLMIAGVGASLSEANADLARLTRLAWESSAMGHATYSFVSRMTEPSVQQGLELTCLLPFKKIVVVPALFFAGYYLQTIYQSVEKIQNSTHKEIILTNPFGDDPLILDALSERLNEARRGEVNIIDLLSEDLEPRREFTIFSSSEGDLQQTL
jgi:sirohydrochlorin cobaltochelatase